MTDHTTTSALSDNRKGERLHFVAVPALVTAHSRRSN